VKPTSVVPIDSAGGRVFDVSDGLVGSVMEHGGADALGLVQAVGRLYEGVDAPISVNLLSRALVAGT